MASLTRDEWTVLWQVAFGQVHRVNRHPLLDRWMVGEHDVTQELRNLCVKELVVTEWVEGNCFLNSKGKGLL